MSRNLPDRPNLEFLKKEAKARLALLQRGDAAAQLADAQHALARDYGFASWPKLKAHVESVATLGAAPGESPLAGRWAADVSRSTRHPANQFRGATIVFAVTGNTLTIDDEFVDEGGQTIRGHHTIEADGVARPTGNGFVVCATWRARNDLETVATKNGEEVGRGRYTVSDDGRTLTITSTGDQVIVLDRV